MPSRRSAKEACRKNKIKQIIIIINNNNNNNGNDNDNDDGDDDVDDGNGDDDDVDDDDDDDNDIVPFDKRQWILRMPRNPHAVFKTPSDLWLPLGKYETNWVNISPLFSETGFSFIFEEFIWRISAF